ncbi:nitroreductase [Paraliobacillus sp. X-1268]|uniref:nitroreductase family protein n=1 Tax=Paraliobacillus sp. X-1268 TaxID=2213193 RepID=UPI000E3E9331|nr:nitroreductase [Paraliobacillus sp. X-1268]
MQLSELIKERRSIQLYEDRPVDIEQLKGMLDTAVWVPNHKMTEPWRFVIVHGNSIEKVAELNRKFSATGSSEEAKKQSGEKAYKKIKDVPVLLMVIMDENPDAKLREEDYAATSCLIQNFSLLAWEQGIGMIWKTGALTTQANFRELIGVKRGEKVVGMLQIGYPAKVPKARPRTDVQERIEELN